MYVCMLRAMCACVCVCLQELIEELGKYHTLWMIKCSVYEAHMSPTLDRHLATCCFNGALNVAMCLNVVMLQAISFLHKTLDELWME